MSLKEKLGSFGSFLASAKSSSKVASPNQAAQGVILGASVSTGSSTVSQATGALGNISFMIFIFGIVHFILRFIGFNSTYLFIFSLALFVFSAYALATKVEKDRVALLIPMLLFLVWYFVFDTSYDPMFLIYFGVISVFLFMLPALFTKGESVKPELLGLLPVLFLFLDLGMLHFITEKLNLQATPLLTNLLLFMPWWALFGLLTLPSQSSKNETVNALINFTKALGILYIIFVFVIPTIPEVGYSKGFLPSPAELEAAQQRVREQLPQTEPTFFSSIKCFFEGRYTDNPACVKEKQEESQIRYICEKVENLNPQTQKESYEECLKDEKEKRKTTTQAVIGIIDRTIKEPTIVTLSVNNDFFPRKSVLPKEKYLLSLDYKNPRELNIEIESSCSFKKMDSLTPSEGVIQFSRSTLNEVAGLEELYCTPATDLAKGEYELTYTIILKNVESVSHLTRFFIGNKTGKEKEAIVNKIKEIERTLSLNSFSESSAAPEFARINFALGNTQKDPLVDSLRPVKLFISIENTGKGKIKSINSYEAELEGFNGACLQGREVAIPQEKLKQQRIILPICEIISYTPDLQNPPTHEKRQFVAKLNYNYELTHKEKITIGEISP